jgi:hypothetical protein
MAIFGEASTLGGRNDFEIESMDPCPSFSRWGVPSRSGRGGCSSTGARRSRTGPFGSMYLADFADFADFGDFSVEVRVPSAMYIK